MAGLAIGGLVGGGIGGGIAGLLAGAITGAVTGALIGGISNVLRGRDFGDNLEGFALQGAIAGGIAGAVSGYNAAMGVQTVSQATKSFMQNFNWNPISRLAAKMTCFGQAATSCPFNVPSCWEALKCIGRGAETITDPNAPTNTNTDTSTNTDTDSAFYGNWENSFV